MLFVGQLDKLHSSRTRRYSAIGFNLPYAEHTARVFLTLLLQSEEGRTENYIEHLETTWNTAFN
jgi:hypothetical protein